MCMCVLVPGAYLPWNDLKWDTSLDIEVALKTDVFWPSLSNVVGLLLITSKIS